MVNADRYPEHLGLRPDEDLECLVDLAEGLPPDRRLLFHQILQELDRLAVEDHLAARRAREAVVEPCSEPQATCFSVSGPQSAS